MRAPRVRIEMIFARVRGEVVCFISRGWEMLIWRAGVRGYSSIYCR